MTINFSAISTSIVKTGVASGTNGTATLVLGGSDTLVVLFIEASLQGGQADSGIVTAGSSFTVGGVALTHVPSALSHAGTSNHGFVDLYWGLTTNAGGSIPTGSQTVSVTINHTGSPGATGNWLVYACSYTGTPQSGGEIGTACKDSDDAASSETLSDGTVTASDLLVGVCCNGSTAPTVTTGQSRGTVNGDTSTASHAGIRVADNNNSGTTIVFGTNSGDSSGATGIRLIADTGGGAAYVRPTIVVAPSQAVHQAANW